MLCQGLHHLTVDKLLVEASLLQAHNSTCNAGDYVYLVGIVQLPDNSVPSGLSQRWMKRRAIEELVLNALSSLPVGSVNPRISLFLFTRMMKRSATSTNR